MYKFTYQKLMGNEPFVVNVSSLTSGIYFVTLKQKNGINTTKKFVKY